MFCVTRRGICCVLIIFERQRSRLGSKISGYGRLAEVALYFAMSGLPPEADTNRKGRHVPWGQKQHLDGRLAASGQTRQADCFDEPFGLRIQAKRRRDGLPTFVIRRETYRDNFTRRMPCPGQRCPSPM